MGERKQLKERAKKNLFANYGFVIIAVFVLAFFGGVSGFDWKTASVQSVKNDVQSVKNVMDRDSSNLIFDIIRERVDLELRAFKTSFVKSYKLESGEYNDMAFLNVSNYDDYIDQEFDEIMNQVSSEVVYIFVLIMLSGFIFGFVIAMVFRTFVTNPISVGGRKWALNNRESDGVESNNSLGTLFYGFKSSYGNISKVLFFRDIKVIGWYLLLIVPGIIKTYEYKMIPYLLAENSKMTSSEAFEISKNLMNGNKWRAFVLDFSFILWGLLCRIPLVGIVVKYLFVFPYQELTSAEFYVQVCMEKGQADLTREIEVKDEWS